MDGPAQVDPSGRLSNDKTESIAKHILKVKDIVKVFATVLPRFQHLTDIDHIEDNLSNVVGAGNAPVAEHSLGQVAVLIEGIPTGRLAELLACEVLLRTFSPPATLA